VNYFLIRSGSSYYSIPAGATEADLAGIVPTDQAGVSANCAAHVAATSAATPYTTDVSNIDLSDFNLGVSGTPVKYLMSNISSGPSSVIKEAYRNAHYAFVQSASRRFRQE